jgi:hypothetical protein
MSKSVQSVQAANAQIQAAQTTNQPAKKPQTTQQTATPQDTVTISASAKQALAGNTKPAASGDVDHDGDNH